MSTFRIGTRASPLALTQTRMAEAYMASFAEFSGIQFITHAMTTSGDRIVDRPLYNEGGKGLFVKELEDALLEDRIDMAINSLKDVESDLGEAFALPAYLPREDPRDVLVTKTVLRLEELPTGALIGTCSPRRMTQLLHLRPDLNITPIRGNVGTRLSLLAEGQVDGLILAAAGLKRLNIETFPMVYLEVDQMVPACGQGILTIECLSAQHDLRKKLADISDPHTTLCALAERALLSALNGSCNTPIGAYARMLPSGVLHLRGMLASQMGHTPVFASLEGPDPITLGRSVATMLRQQMSKE